jgi:methylthioribose-1-phosphate isomerase
MSIPGGSSIPIEERDPQEVTHIGGVSIAPDGIEARNIAFDVTPHELVAGIVTEWGIAVEPYEDSFKAFFARKSEEESQ